MGASRVEEGFFFRSSAAREASEAAPIGNAETRFALPSLRPPSSALSPSLLTVRKELTRAPSGGPCSGRLEEGLILAGVLLFFSAARATTLFPLFPPTTLACALLSIILYV